MSKTIQNHGATRITQSLSRVLVVGSFGTNHKGLLAQLDFWGLKVQCARTSQDALATVGAFNPDVVLLHWDSLELAGPGFLRKLRMTRIKTYPHVIAINDPFGLAPPDILQALESGADAVQPMGLDIDLLVAQLKAADRHHGWQAAQTERLSDVQSRLEALHQKHESLDSDLLEAKRLQQSLLKDRHIAYETGSLSFFLRSSGHVGGDFVGQFPVDANRTAFFALDVSGHGVSSALLAARLAGFLTAASPAQNIALDVHADGSVALRPLAEAVGELNAVVMEELETEHYFTLLLALVDLRSGHVQAVQAGHPHPVLQRANGNTEFVGQGGLPVGLIPGADYEVWEVTLAAGDRLLVTSDGFTEATLPDGSLLGDAGLIKLLNAAQDVDAHKVLDAMVWDLSRLSQDQDFEDDVSGILLEFTGP